MGNESSAESGSGPKAAGKARDMSLAQLTRYDGKAVGEKKTHAYVALRGEIFDVTLERESLEGEFGAWFGKNKTDATDDEVARLRAACAVLGKVIPQRLITLDELRRSRGEEEGQPILIAARGLVFDVTSGASFYGPGGGYHLFSGHNAQRALAKMSLKEEDVSNSSLEDLEPKDLKILDDWISKFYDKYPLVGTLKEEDGASEGTSAASPV